MADKQIPDDAARRNLLALAQWCEAATGPDESINKALAEAFRKPRCEYTRYFPHAETLLNGRSFSLVSGRGRWGIQCEQLKLYASNYALACCAVACRVAASL